MSGDGRHFVIFLFFSDFVFFHLYFILSQGRKRWYSFFSSFLYFFFFSRSFFFLDRPSLFAIFLDCLSLPLVPTSLLSPSLLPPPLPVPHFPSLPSSIATSTCSFSLFIFCSFFFSSLLPHLASYCYPLLFTSPHLRFLLFSPHSPFSSPLKTYAPPSPSLLLPSVTSESSPSSRLHAESFPLVLTNYLLPVPKSP